MTVKETDPEVTAVPLREDFERFYASQIRQVIGLAYVLSGSRSGAEDLAQDAFLAAYRNWDRIGMYEDPGAWVRKVVSNGSVSFFRSRKARTKALLRLTGRESVVPELSADAMETWSAVRRLPTQQAQTVALRYYDRSSVPEIAEILGCSVNTVKTHLRRAKKALAAELDEGGES